MPSGLPVKNRDSPPPLCSEKGLTHACPSALAVSPASAPAAATLAPTTAAPARARNSPAIWSSRAVMGWWCGAWFGLGVRARPGERTSEAKEREEKRLFSLHSKVTPRWPPASVLWRATHARPRRALPRANHHGSSHLDCGRGRERGAFALCFDVKDASRSRRSLTRPRLTSSHLLTHPAGIHPHQSGHGA